MQPQPTPPQPPPQRNLTKPFSIAGFILGEIYLVFIVFGHSPSGEIVPLEHQIKRLVVFAPFLGLFGALVGMGLGLIATALYAKLRRN